MRSFCRRNEQSTNKVDLAITEAHLLLSVRRGWNDSNVPQRNGTGCLAAVDGAGNNLSVPRTIKNDFSLTRLQLEVDMRRFVTKINKGLTEQSFVRYTDCATQGPVRIPCEFNNGFGCRAGRFGNPFPPTRQSLGGSVRRRTSMKQ